jgi:acyl-CoA synthetase (AMP-forming)/AMP-acid ligase II
VVRGPAVFTGYLDDPAANAAAFTPDGWFRTGDIGYLDEDGFLYLQGRANEIINRGGENIAPAEVDRVLQSHPAVAEAAVFGVPDARFGEDLIAAVVIRAGMSVSPRELRAWMLDRLSPSKTPHRLWVIDAIPRTPTGKVQRGELARLWAEARP